MFKKKENKTTDVWSTLPVDYQILMTTVQDFLPFEDIENSMICLPNSEYRMVIEVSSMNYYLKTAQEQENIEAMFRSAISSWDFPFAFYTQTRSLDADEIEMHLKDDVAKCQSTELRTYGEQYIREMHQLNRGKTATLIKKNYIIVECNDANLIVSNRSEEEKRSFAFDRLVLNARKVSEGLSPMGLACKVLNNDELVMLLFIALNKHSQFSMNDILCHMADTVFPYEEWSETTVEQVFEGFRTQLNNLLLRTHNLNGTEIEKAHALLKAIDNIKTETIEESDTYFDL